MRIPTVILLVSVLGLVRTASAQISPGDLSKAHRDLEGITNCTKCHETGEKLSNAKCLSCHTEIAGLIGRKLGIHALNANSPCESCHAEHLGRDAVITKFEPNSFDHTKTGFTLTGKHTGLKCEQCHGETKFLSAEIKKVLAATPHKTYLGLNPACSTCHPDHHQTTVGLECQTCHGTSGWTPATAFDHAKTKFALAGRHTKVECASCHGAMKHKTATQPLLFTTASFNDCTPCHASPHGKQFADKTCRSCHTAEGWNVVVSFNHSTTRFPLVGKHTTVPCEKCHTEMSAHVTKRVSFKTLKFDDCTPCHNSPHEKKITEKTCSSCHAATAWSDKSMSGFDHSLTSFTLKGKHAELKCEQCHKPSLGPGFKKVFLISGKNCTDCHEDEHRGQFAQNYFNNCAVCHGETVFKPSSFGVAAHSKARFALEGAHAALACRECHKEDRINGVKTVQFTATPTECYSCHHDIHAGQFVRDGVTRCLTCHSTVAWHTLTFDHDVQSTFPLTGAHRKVPCGSCHKQERVGSVTAVRYTPLSGKCESCHQGMKQQGSLQE